MWEISSDWFRPDLNPTHTPDPLTPDTPEKSELRPHGPSSADTDPGGPKRRGPLTSGVCTSLPLLTPQPFPLVPPTVSPLPPPEKEFLQGKFDDAFSQWFNGQGAWENLLEAAVDSLPGIAKFFSGEAESVQKVGILTESYTVTDDLRDKIVAWAGITPTVDAFASAKNKRFPRHWEDAFREDWSSEILWANPPFSRMPEVIDKICLERAKGILIVPEWPSQAWYHVLGTIALGWWEIPHDVPLFQTEEGILLPQRKNWHTRAVVFDAFACNKFATGTMGQEGGDSESPPSYPWPHQKSEEERDDGGATDTAPPNRGRRRAKKRWMDHIKGVQEAQRKKKEERMASVKREKEKWEKFLVERRAPYPYPKDNPPLVIARTSLLKPVAPPSAALREENPPPPTDVLECRIDIPPPDELEWNVDGTPPQDEAYWEYDIENPPP